MPLTINFKEPCKNFIDFKLIFSFLLYITCFLVYYFVGIKSNDKQRKNYNDLPIFLTIILYVYNCYVLYSYTRKKDKAPCPLIVWLQIGLFYVLNLVIMYAYFNPLEKEQTQTVDASGNPVEDSYKDNKWGIFAGMSIFGLITLVLGALTFVPEFKDIIPPQWAQTVIRLFIVLFVFFGLLFTTIYLLVRTPWSLTLIVNILNIGILIGLLAIMYTLGKTLFAKSGTASYKPSLLNLLKLALFYIPCLFIDLITYLKKQVGLTKPTAWVLLLVELIIIVLRIVVPIIYKKISKLTTKGDLIIEGPIYTNEETDLGVFQNHKADLGDLELNKKAVFNYNYALSCWIWINPQPASTNDAYSKSTTLLNYGNIVKINFNKNKIEIFAATTRDTVLVKELVKIYELKNIPYQKWNNFVLNYSGGTLDIFINGKLVSSNINITPVMYYDRMTAGALNGIYGGIKDIVYYDKVLSQREIEAINSKII